MSLNKANLLLITFDQWRGDWTDPEDPVVRMPCLEKIAAQGLAARRCYTSSPQCVPARHSWLTGLAPSQLGITRNCEAEVPANAPSVFRNLQQEGWYTELIGKTHWTNHLKPGDLREKRELIKSLGFDEVNEVAGPRALQIMSCELTDAWKKENVFDQYLEDMKKRYRQGRTDAAWDVRPSVLPNHLYPDIWIADQGIKAIQRMPESQPWLLWISFIGPHEPFDTPLQWKNKNKSTVTKFTKRADWINQLPIDSELRKSAKAWDNKLTKEAIEACRKDYADNLRLLDDQLQRLIAATNRRNDAEETAIAVTADHGEMLGDHEMLYKGTFLEGSIRVPFQYVPPSNTREEKAVVNRPIGLTDTLKTTINNLKEGGSLKTLQWHCKQQKHVTVEFGNELLIIKNKLKLCCNLKGEALWCINLNKDPQEKTDLLTKNLRLFDESKRWKRLLLIAKKQVRLRQKENWRWIS
jgi:arylsulfatase